MLDRDIVFNKNTYNQIGGGSGSGSGELCRLFGKTGELSHNYGKDFSWVNKDYTRTPEYRETSASHKRGKISVKYPDGRCELLDKNHPDILSGLAIFVCVGRIVSDETRKKISKGNLGKIISEESRQKQILNASCPEYRRLCGEKNIGRKHTKQTKKILSDIAKSKPIDPKFTRKGAVVLTETRLKLSIASKLNHKITASCIYCKLSTILPNIVRWHMLNCKKNIDDV